jgi:hypothetical protein
MISLPMFVRPFSHFQQLAHGYDQIATPIWRRSVDKKVIAHREEHRQYLQQNGFFANA